ncbi:MAG: hypothetical protein H6555_07215 [Lewinellaceae bacterium]|nr:hypothetical protein [Lewinellaceae bacterium]
MKYIALLIGLFLVNTLSAQKITVSDEIPLRTDVSYEIIGELKGRVLLFRNQTTRFEVQAFDERMQTSWSKELEFDKRMLTVLGINTFDDQFTIFYRFRERGSTLIKAARFDASATLRDSVIVQDFGFLFVTPDYEVVRSEDRSKVLFFYTEKSNVFRVLSFDNRSMKLLWDKTFTLEDFNEYEDLVHMMVDNDGNMYAVIEEDNFSQRRQEGQFRLVRYGGEGTEITTTKVQIPEIMIYDVKFSYDNLNKNVVAGGFYYNKNQEKAEGFFYLRFPVSAGGPLVGVHPFSDELVSNLEGKRVKNNRGMEEIGVQDIVIRRDGGILIVGEEYKNYQRRIASVNRVMYDNFSRSVVDYYYNDVFLLAVNPDGLPHWETVLYKKQYSQDDQGMYSSFFLFKTPSKLHLIFNDEIKFENTISEYVVRGTGTFQRNSMLSTENLKLRLRFRDAMQVSSTKLVVPSERRGKLRIARIELI